MNDKQTLARDNLISKADLLWIAEHIPRIANELNERFNDAGINMATSLLARAMLAQSLLSIATTWWAEDLGADREVVGPALRSIVDQLPDGFVDQSYRDPTITNFPTLQ